MFVSDGGGGGEGGTGGGPSNGGSADGLGGGAIIFSARVILIRWGRYRCFGIQRAGDVRKVKERAVGNVGNVGGHHIVREGYRCERKDR